MRLGKLVIPTTVIHRGDTLRKVLRECVRTNVGGLPYADESGRLQGRISMRNIMRERCIPSYMLKAAHLVGDKAEFNMSGVELKALLDLPVEGFVIPNVTTVSSSTPVIKGMAMMEQYDTSYLFLLDGDNYLGVVTRMLIARRILEIEADNETL